jgi:hypothetical protein
MLLDFLNIGSKIIDKIYPSDDNGGVAIIVPADCGLTIEEIAAKDVPAGTPYIIVDVADIPTDRTFRNAWEYTS